MENLLHALVAAQVASRIRTTSNGPSLRMPGVLLLNPQSIGTPGDDPDHMEYPMREAAVEAATSLKHVMHYMRKFVEASANMEKHIQYLPKNVRMGFELQNVYGKHVSELMSAFLDHGSVRSMSSYSEGMLAKKLGPIPREIWVNEWMNDKGLEDLPVPEDTENGGPNETTCLYCATNAPNVIIRNCKCPSTSCASCMLSHYYSSTNQTKMSYSTCPTCKHEFSIDDIIPSKEFYIKNVIKEHSTGKTLPGSRLCSECGKKTADCHNTCCDKASQEYKCDQCFIGPMWERHRDGKKEECIHCKTTKTNPIIHKTFVYRTPTTSTSLQTSSKKRKV